VGLSRRVEAETEVAALVLAPGEDAVRAWARLPAGTAAAYVRFPRGGDLPLAAVQRLARRGSILVDAAPRDAQDALDLAVAGAAGIVAWLSDGGDVRAMADTMGDALVVGCTARDLDAAAALARELGVPVLVALPAELPEGVHGYVMEAEATQPPRVRRFGPWPEPHAAEDAASDAAGGDAEEDEDKEAEEEGP
jgi:hypothetical protein